MAVTGLWKSFGAVDALRGVSLELYAGKVTALVGDNGAGKSTLVKVLTGAHRASAGEIRIDGRPVEISHPSHATDLGVAAVYQDLALCGNLDVTENVFLGREVRRSGLGWLRWFAPVDRVAARLHASELLESLRVNLPDPRAKVDNLSGGQRQSVAIVRALLGSPRVVILDEPTAALSVAQTTEVLALVRRLRDHGHAVLIISHNLADVFSVADVIAVLRLGRNAGVFDVSSGVRQEAVVAAMTGAGWEAEA